MTDPVLVRSVVVEALIGEPQPPPLLASSVVFERLVGDEYGYTALFNSSNIIVEALVSEAPIRAKTVVVETLVRRDIDELSQQRMTFGFVQTAVAARDTMAPPSAFSMNTVFILRAMAIAKRVPAAPRSIEYLGALTSTVASRRLVARADQVSSTTTAMTLVQQVVTSRNRAYIPTSGVYVSSARQQVVAAKSVTPAGEMWSPLDVGIMVQQVLQSRRVAPIATDVFAAALVQQVVGKDTRPAPHSMIDVTTFAQMVVARRTVTPPGIDVRVAGYVQQVVYQVVPVEPFGSVQVGTLASLVTTRRDMEAPRSPEYVGGLVQQVVQYRLTPAPGFLLGWRPSTLHQQVIARRDHAPIISHTYVSSLRVAFVQFRDTPHPADVIDPAVGRHAASLHQQIVQHRVTLPPEQGSKATFVYALVEQLAHSDKFPPPDYPPQASEVTVFAVAEVVMAHDGDPWEPVSVLQASSLVEQVAIGDAVGWEDPTIPHSDIRAMAVIEQVAVGDTFIDVDTPQSAAEVMALIEQVASGDKFVDPLIPQSSVQVEQVVEVVASGDKFADPLIPISVAQVLGLAEAVAFHDDDLTGKFTMSTITVNVVAQVVVLPDKTMKGIPLRHGPRPVVSITIS